MKQFIDALTDEEAAAVVAAMREIADGGLEYARHLRGDIYEVRADAVRRTFRILFARETKFILLALSGILKDHSQDTRPRAGAGRVAVSRLARARALTLESTVIALEL